MYVHLVAFLLPMFKGRQGDWLPCYRVPWGGDWSPSMHYWLPILQFFSLNLECCIVATFLST